MTSNPQPSFSIVFIDGSTGREIVCFWNPRIKARMCFLRYERGHKLFPRFIRFLYSIWMCVSCKGSSIRPKYNWTQNIVIEAQACYEITFEEYRKWVTDNDMYKEIENIEHLYGHRCFECIGNFNEGIDRDITGTEFFSIKEESYCCIKRGDMKELQKGKERKCKCYREDEYDDFIGFTGKLPKCE